MALTKSTDPLVWIDCEMTGLDPETDTILSIACVITTHDLEPLDPGPDLAGYYAVIATPPSALARMSEWCVRTHGASGLTAACQSATAIPATTAAAELRTYIRRWVPEPGRALLAGNSVHVDKLFLMREPWGGSVGGSGDGGHGDGVLDWLNYRILDVSALKEAVRRWCPEHVVAQMPPKKELHEAKADVWESIEEARFYMALLKGQLSM